MACADQPKEPRKDYRSLLEAIPDAAVVYNNQGHVLYVNTVFVAIYGWSREELIGRKIDFGPADDIERTRQALDRAIRGEKVSFETRRLTRDGRLLDSQISSALLLDWDGNDTAMIVIHRDVTELKQAGRQLKRYRDNLEDLVVPRTREARESEGSYRILLDSSPDPVSVYNRNGKITYLNPAFEQTFGRGIPVMDGFGATRRIKARPKGHDTCVVAVTAHALEEERMTILEAGCDDFLSKPFWDTELFEIISRRLNACFLYQDQFDDTGANRVDADAADPAALIQFPADWVEALRRDAGMSDPEAVHGIIDQVRTVNVAMADALSGMVKTFRFDKLRQLHGRLGKSDDLQQ